MEDFKTFININKYLRIIEINKFNLNIEAGIMVTASHNPANENGFKIFGEKFLHLKRPELEKLYEMLKIMPIKILLDTPNI